MQWLNNSATFRLDEVGTNDLLITPASYSPASNPKYNEVTIVVSDNTVATVEYEEAPQDGVLTYSVTPLAEGTATVTATLGELTASFTLEVTESLTIESIEFSEPSLLLERLESTTLQVLAQPSGTPLTGLTITSSDDFLVNAFEDEDNPGTYNVYASETVTGGTATLSVSYEGYSDTCSIEVTIPTLESFTLDYDNPLEPLQVGVGYSEIINVMPSPYNAVLLPSDFTGTPSASAENKATFTIDSTYGYISGITVEGLAEASGLTYTLTNNDDSSMTDTAYVDIIQ